VEILRRRLQRRRHQQPFNGSYCNICNPFEYQSNYPSVVADHMRDITDLFTDLANGTLPAVSYVKPDGTMDGHPHRPNGAYSRRLPRTSSSSRRATGSCGPRPRFSSRWTKAAGITTRDSSSRLISSAPAAHSDDRRVALLNGRAHQPRVQRTFLVREVHRTQLAAQRTLSERSRDNLPILCRTDDNTYVPRNMPAIGDLFDLFRFGHEGGGG